MQRARSVIPAVALGPVGFAVASWVDVGLKAVVLSLIAGGRELRQLIVRKVEAEVVSALKRRAARHGRSAEAEHREILREALGRELGGASFKSLLAAMPDVGTDADFAVERDLPREVE